GRPETPQETADRKAESSRIYRSSQSFRNLIAALIATVAVVAIIVFAVPRGEPTPRPAIDVAKIASDVESTMDRPVGVPEVGDDWRVNAAGPGGGAGAGWNITLAPPPARSAPVPVGALIVVAAPRGAPTPRPAIDVAKIASDVESTMDRPVVVPEVGDDWRVNAAGLDGGAVTVWNITLAPSGERERGF